MASQFVQKIVNWIANEVIIKQLSQNKSFQNMALRTHLNVEKSKEFAKQNFEDVIDGVHSKATKTIRDGSGGGKPKLGSQFSRQPPKTGVFGFFSAVGKEVRKDFGG